MLNATVRAAAAGLSSALFDRRRMLLGLAAASTAAAGPVALAGENAPTEDPALMQLGDLTEAIANAQRTARDELAKIYAEWDPKLPAVPAEIKFKRHSFDDRGSWEKRLDGAARHWGDDNRDGVLTVEGAEHKVTWTKEYLAQPPRFKSASGQARHERWMGKLRVNLAQEEAALKLAKRYHGEFTSVLKASGYEPARKRLTAAEDALNQHVTAIMKHEAQTMAGVMIQAQAIEATRQMPAYVMAIEGSRERWAARLAAAILRIAGSAA
ncbi:hypothetical protein [Bosea sp. AS-1]|uniref:hypothetical protein n=1 Tax=Bosea sp. AS-1 TaxID=2015316 RepID=UPI000B793518|nr:hypothetical protein [Bosea sp. AS-1]